MSQTLESKDLDYLWDKLSHHCILVEQQKRIGFNEFITVRKYSLKFIPFLSASVFAQLPKDQDGTISVLHFFNYVLRKGI